VVVVVAAAAAAIHLVEVRWCPSEIFGHWLTFFGRV